MSVASQRWLHALATLAGFAVFACVLAYWGWRWLGPAPYVASAPVIDDPARALAVSPPFGAPAEPAAAPAQAAAPASEGRLLGVFAEADGSGHALFRLPDNVARLVAAGGQVTKDVSVVAVRPDGVTLRDANGERFVALRGSADTRRAASTTRSAAAPAGCAIPPGYKGPVVRLNGELVQGLMSQPEALRAIAEARDGGLVVREEGGFAALLGMKKGDRVAQANGIALRAPEDVVFAVLRPLAASQVVRLTGSRGGEARELVIVNAGACP